MKFIFQILAVFLLSACSNAFVTTFRRSNLHLSTLKVASFDLTPRSKPGVKPFRTQIDLLYDSECPLCAMEVEFLRKRDVDNKIKFTDLSSLDYNPSDHGNVKFSDGMRKIRAVLPETNEVVTGVEVFRQVYRSAVNCDSVILLTICLLYCPTYFVIHLCIIASSHYYLGQ